MPRRPQLLPPDDLVMVDACQIDGRAMTTVHVVDLILVVLDAANADGDATRLDYQLVVLVRASPVRPGVAWDIHNACTRSHQSPRPVRSS